jgi:large subunit ribosomal protein L2
LLNSTLVPFKSGNSLPLMNVPLNVKICLIESFPGSGPRFVRSPGSWAVVHSKDAEFVKVIFRNGGHRFFHITCLSVLGAVSNSKQKLRKFYKAGNSHKFGRRPRVRGVAQNPVDHPHGGGKGKKSKNAVPEGP